MASKTSMPVPKEEKVEERTNPPETSPPETSLPEAKVKAMPKAPVPAPEPVESQAHEEPVAADSHLDCFGKPHVT